MDDPREPLGRIVHEQRLAFNAEKERPFVLLPWEERDDTQRELDMRIGAAVAAAGRERIAAALEDYAASYPEDIFPPGSDSRDAIGGTAMRHAYRNAARIAREEEGDRG